MGKKKSRDVSELKDKLRDLIAYDPSTGVATSLRRGVVVRKTKWSWAVIVRSHFVLGSGSLALTYRLQDVAWLWATGNAPSSKVENLNGDYCDNRFSNLYETRNLGLEPTQEFLKTVFLYDETTGIFTWVRPWAASSALIGKRAGSLARHGNGYIVMSLGGKRYYAHRLAWLYVHGEWPKTKHLDHINGIKTDNRIGNLREATSRQNSMNCKINKLNTSGFRGVTWCSQAGKWQAKCRMKDGTTRHLGTFSDPAEAAKVRDAAVSAEHGEFARVA